ncbi:OmpH family outer membrane protein [Pseudomarimonas salicorniae]|uniref:OmpH family outer membrane protein n=1 Tax=Pseudomarimonas salicorniae TaxID=2933270 RepID=A0ABT0GDJ8_9GAMM|nr:OmpH family outer membrane protein [Lysobacter sp. CAU 1642]MCK7592624.1 OmpH family outer membrane protein [Lysobacter sp. CAU 1642]
MNRPIHARGRASRRILCVLGWLLLGFSALTGAQERAQKIALVDMQRLLDEAPQMAAAKTRLTREFADRNADLVQQRSQLEQMQRRLREQGASMPQADAEQLARDIDVLRRALERAQDRLRDELAARNREERDRVWLQLNDTVAQYARDAGIDLVLPTPVLYASARVDITDRILDRLRQQAREESR